MSVATQSRGLVHEALVYADPDQFVAAAAPFLRKGLADDDPVLAVTDAAKITLLRATLGADAGAIQFAESAEWYASPGKATAAYEAWAQARVKGAAKRLWILGEPPWADRSEAGVREWTRYESFLNVGFEDVPASIVCPYDTTSVPSSIVVGAHRTHPLIRRHTGVAPSDLFTEPTALSRQLDEAPLAATPNEPRGFEFTSPIELRGLRRFVNEVAGTLPLPRERLADLELATNEVATNVLRHGGGVGTVRISTDDRRIVTDVSDRGGGIADPFPGCRPPSKQTTGGWGLWLVRQLCDLVEVRTSSSGTTVRMHMSMSA